MAENGIILYEGASQIDGAPIAVIATGLAASTRNGKTGNLIQTWILRADIEPHKAIHSGADESICGACPHRGVIENGRNKARSCYVIAHQAPLVVFRAMARGLYERPSLATVADMLEGRNVRLGAYGDPAAVPLAVWDQALARAARGTGYTHQWRNAPRGFARYCMASADNAQEAQEAQALGYRTFRVGTPAEKVARGEFLCPASKEAGQKVNCAACLACGGTSSPNKASVFIPAHGQASKVNAFTARARAA